MPLPNGSGSKRKRAGTKEAIESGAKDQPKQKSKILVEIPPYLTKFSRSLIHWSVNCKYFSRLAAGSIAALLPISFGQASFAENFNTYTDENGNTYCIGVKTGQYYFAGLNAEGKLTAASQLSPPPTGSVKMYQYATSITCLLYTSPSPRD